MKIVETIYARSGPPIARSPGALLLAGAAPIYIPITGEHGGFSIAAAIDKYVYVTVTRPFTEGIYLKYSHLEHVQQISQVQHPIIREGLSLLGFKTPQVEITTLAHIPAGTGLGSSAASQRRCSRPSTRIVVGT